MSYVVVVVQLVYVEEYLSPYPIPQNLSGWDVEAEDPEPVEDCPRCDGTGYVVDDYTFQSVVCSSCAGAGIKDYAKRLAPTSLEQG